ncbi:unnamed protein product [Tetraodon nigroviridis]|uniref:(spotted green pufferfish) hypothetical protein n=1 Tax=Tetraodon nigroviridis TaxID=99883 RepID=Q4RV47_TETNG|nr:unnamed protein product [Tetraodon nigroviridis]
MEIWQERAREDRYNIDWRDKVGHRKRESGDNKAERQYLIVKGKTTSLHEEEGGENESQVLGCHGSPGNTRADRRRVPAER